MKKIIAVSILAAMLLSAVSCSYNKNGPSDTNAVTTATTDEPAAKPTPITVDEVKDFIASVKEEYATATEFTLADGTVISAEVKDPGITAESVSSGEATMDQMTAYATYMANIRQIVCDKLPAFFPEENKVIFSENTDIDADFLFLDPVSDGYDTSGEAFAEMASEDREDDVVTDYIVIQDNMVVLLDADTNSSSVICPTEEDNNILIAILKRVDPEAIKD